jgi:hypothetical protein
MNANRHTGRVGRQAGLLRLRGKRTPKRPPSLKERARPIASAQAASMALLSEVLVGDTGWSLAEVQRLIAVRDLADLGRWRVAGLDEEGPSAA